MSPRPMILAALATAALFTSTVAVMSPASAVSTARHAAVAEQVRAAI